MCAHWHAESPQPLAHAELGVAVGEVGMVAFWVAEAGEASALSEPAGPVLVGPVWHFLCKEVVHLDLYDETAARAGWEPGWMLLDSPSFHP